MREHERVNEEAWNGYAERYVAPGRRNWAAHEISWGIFDMPEERVRALPRDVSGLDVIELGCGTGYVSAWLARRGARPIGIDLSERQLETARALQAEHGIEFPLIHGSAESVPLPDASFDLAVSEYGAALWCDPERWIAEAARLLRPGGRLVFLTNHPWLIVCSAPDEPQAGERLARPLFGMRAVSWEDEPGIEFHIGHGETSEILFRNGLLTERIIELPAPEGADSGQWDFVTLEWAQKWPAEMIWVAVKQIL